MPWAEADDSEDPCRYLANEEEVKKLGTTSFILYKGALDLEIPVVMEAFSDDDEGKFSLLPCLRREYEDEGTLLPAPAKK